MAADDGSKGDDPTEWRPQVFHFQLEQESGAPGLSLRAASGLEDGGELVTLATDANAGDLVKQLTEGWQEPRALRVTLRDEAGSPTMAWSLSGAVCAQVRRDASSIEIDVRHRGVALA